MGIFDAALGIIEGGWNRDHQERMLQASHENNKESMGLQYEYNEKAAENAQKRAEKLYRQYQSPEAMVKQLKEAGLSTGLMYSGLGGKSGMGVIGNGPQGGVGSPSSAATGSNPFAISAGGMLKEAAEIGLMNAQARKLNTEADTESGTNKRGETEIQKMQQEIKNLQTQEIGIQAKTQLDKTMAALVEMQAAGQDLENQASEQTLAARVNIYAEKANQAAIETRIASERLKNDKRANEIGDATKKITISQTIADYRMTMRSIARVNSEINLNEAQITKLQQEVNVLVWEAVKKHWESVNEFLEQDNFTRKMEATYADIEAGLERAKMMKSAMIWSSAIGSGKNVIEGAIKLAYPIKSIKGFGK